MILRRGNSSRQRLKKINFFFDSGQLLLINLKKIEFGFILSIIKKKKKREHFFWNIVSFFYLAGKINECALKPSMYIEIFFFFFQKKNKNSIWYSNFKKIKIEKILKKIIKTAERIFLKNTDFFFDSAKKKFIVETVNNSMELWYREINKDVLSFPKNFVDENHKHDYDYLDLILEKMDKQIGYFWVKTKIEKDFIPKRWWKFMNTRESELEFYEQNYIYIKSIGKFK